MTTVTPGSEREERQERRRHARHPQGVPLGAELQCDRMEAPLSVQLVDVSLGGVCLLTRPVFHLHRGQRGELCCSGVHHPLVGDLERHRIRICWVETREWLSVVGVAFDEGLPA